MFEDHPGEVRLRIEATTLAGVFEEAARALAELMLGQGGSEPPGPDETVHVEAADAASLLVNWLNELVFLSETKKRIYTQVSVMAVTERQVEAKLRGVYPESLRTEVKAATLHGLRLEHVAGLYSATVVLDV